MVAFAGSDSRALSSASIASSLRPLRSSRSAFRRMSSVPPAPSAQPCTAAFSASAICLGFGSRSWASSAHDSPCCLPPARSSADLTESIARGISSRRRWSRAFSRYCSTVGSCSIAASTAANDWSLESPDIRSFIPDRKLWSAGVALPIASNRFTLRSAVSGSSSESLRNSDSSSGTCESCSVTQCASASMSPASLASAARQRIAARLPGASEVATSL